MAQRQTPRRPQSAELCSHVRQAAARPRVIRVALMSNAYARRWYSSPSHRPRYTLPSVQDTGSHAHRSTYRPPETWVRVRVARRQAGWVWVCAAGACVVCGVRGGVVWGGVGGRWWGWKRCR